MPEEIAVIVIVAIACGTASSIIRSIFSYLKAREQQPAGRGSSLTTSELEAMLRQVVEEAVQPLGDRVARIEDRLAAPGLLPEAPPEAWTGEREAEAEEVAVRRRPSRH